MPDERPLPWAGSIQVSHQLFDKVSRGIIGPSQSAVVMAEVQQAFLGTEGIERLVEAGDRAAESHMLIDIHDHEPDHAPPIQLGQDLG